jgi:uncharacterized protein DUF3383
MATPATLPISNIVDVVVSITPTAPALPQFNQGLITGTSTVIPSVGGVNNRIRQYSTLAQMIADGFTTSSPEYIAAQIYFNQNFNGDPAQYVWVGVQDLTALISIAIHTAGTGYSVGSTFSIAGGSTLATGTVTAESGGIPSAITINGYSSGTGYTTATNVATTELTGGGSGLTVNTTAGETCLIALEQCRLANLQWYAAMCCGSVTADHEAIAAWVQSATPSSFYFFSTPDAAVPAGTAGNVFAALKADSYSRVLGCYNTTQGGTAANNIYAGAALLGIAMGLNTGLANSYFTLAFKTMVGITPEPLTQTQVTTILNNNGNIFVTIGNAYQIIQNGIMPNGNQFGITLGLDMLTSDIQYSEMDVLVDTDNVPQTDPGEVMLIQPVNAAAGRAQTRGFLAGGTWQGATISPGGPNSLFAGTTLPDGYLALTAPYSTQAPSAKAAGQAMPIYLAVITSGTVLSLIVQVNVQL